MSNNTMIMLETHIAGLRNAAASGGMTLSESACTNLANDLSKLAHIISAAIEVRAAHRDLPDTSHPTREAVEARIGRAHYALETAIAQQSAAERTAAGFHNFLSLLRLDGAYIPLSDAAVAALLCDALHVWDVHADRGTQAGRTTSEELQIALGELLDQGEFSNDEEA